MNTIVARVKEYLIAKGIKVSAAESIIGLANGTLSKAINDNKSIKTDTLEKFLNFYSDINPFWLTTGNGVMLTSMTDERPYKGLPLIPLDAMAGFGNGAIQIHENQVTDYYEVPLFEKRGAKYLIPVAGNSMYPKYASGDLLACKPLKGLSFVQWGKPYVLDTEQGAIVKRLFQHPNDESLLICKSDNTEHYPPFPINKEEIYKVAIVVGVIRLE